MKILSTILFGKGKKGKSPLIILIKQLGTFIYKITQIIVEVFKMAGKEINKLRIKSIQNEKKKLAIQQPISLKIKSKSKTLKSNIIYPTQFQKAK